MLVCVLVWPLPDVVTSALEAAVSYAGIALPIVARVAIVLVGDALRLAMMIAAIRIGETWEPPRQTLWIVFGVAALVGLVATIGVTMLHAASSMLLSHSVGVEQFGAYAQEGAYVGFVAVALHSVVTIAAAAYAVSRATRAA